jgi:hypothetical protein
MAAFEALMRCPTCDHMQQSARLRALDVAGAGPCGSPASDSPPSPGTDPLRQVLTACNIQGI